jgi:hypothetical protein
VAGTLDFSGTLTTQPACNQGSALPAGMDNVPYAASPPCKPWSVKTGDVQASVASPSSYVTLAGVGAGGPVTKASFLMLRTVTGLTIRLTFADATVSVLPGVAGMLVLEPLAGKEVVLVEAQGTDTVEYFASGLA